MVSTLSRSRGLLPTLCYPQPSTTVFGAMPPFRFRSPLAICARAGCPPDPVRGTLLQASQVQLGNGGKARASGTNVIPLFAHRRDYAHTPAFANETCRFLYTADAHATGPQKQARHRVMLTVYLRPVRIVSIADDI